MAEVFTPGKFLTVDEVMSAWKGLSTTFDASGIPHQTKIARKPEGTGAEMKSVACALSLVILQLEAMEGKDANRAKQWTEEFGEGAAICLRLCQRWAGSARIVIADSAFSSVKTLIALFCLLGLYFGGMVKTAHTHFPKKYFKNWFRGEDEEHTRDPINNPRGSWITLQSTFTHIRNPLDQREYPIYAVGWADKKLKHIVCNYGTSHRCPTDSRRKRKKVVTDPVTGFNETIDYEKLIKRPDFIKKFFDAFAAIDINDHYRQGILEMERNWLTSKWWVRIFTTITAIVFVNCYFAYKLEYLERNAFIADEEGLMDLTSFLGKLAHGLIFNAGSEVGRRLRQRDRDGDVDDGENLVHQHRLNALSELPVYGGISRESNNRAKRRCKLCNKTASYYCATCSDINNEVLYVVCGPMSRNKCCLEHFQNIQPE